MRRREVLGGLSSVVAWPFAVRAQQAGRVARVVFWMGGTAPSDPVGLRFSAAFRNALRALGWENGRNVLIEERAIGSLTEAAQIRAAVAEFSALAPDVIVTTGAPILAELHRHTKSVPIVFTMVTDPVSDGFVASLARPGGNITGFTIFEHSFAGKWLEMLKEVVPGMVRVAVLQNPDHPAWNAYLNAVRTMAGPMGVEVTPTPASNPPEVTAALDKFAGPNSGLIVLPSAVGTRHREHIASTALKHGLPSIYSLSMYPMSGGLMSYGVVQSEVYVQAATYVDRILKGAKPGDLPVQATKFEMVINLKTAKALGITVPATMLGRADEVIE
jgi:putative tryptophan/tyrosine transport system substrate-binding protein